MKLDKKTKKLLLQQGIQNIASQRYLTEVDLQLMKLRALDGIKDAAEAAEQLEKRLDYLTDQEAHYESTHKDL